MTKWERRGDEMAKEKNAVKTKAPTSVLSDILLLLLKILIVILLFVLLFTFLFGATRYNDVAMTPNIKSGDLVIYSRVDKDFDVGQEGGRPQVPGQDPGHASGGSSG